MTVEWTAALAEPEALAEPLEPEALAEPEDLEALLKHFCASDMKISAFGALVAEIGLKRWWTDY